MQLENPEITLYYFNGKPGAGKDTQAEQLVLFLASNGRPSLQLSTGDMMRGARKRVEPFARYYDLIAPYADIMDSGGLVPSDVVNDLFGAVVSGYIKEGIYQDVEVTGYPRAIEQLKAVDSFHKRLRQEGIAENTVHIWLQSTDQTAIDRALGRRAKGIIRADDDPNVLERRLRAFTDETEPMLKKLDSQQRVWVINAERTIEEIAAEIQERAFDRFIRRQVA